MNTNLMHALMILRMECSRALDAVQIDQPIPPQLGVALVMLDEELSSESYRSRVLEAESARRDRDRAQETEAQTAAQMASRNDIDAALSLDLESLKRLRQAAQEHGFINAEGVVTAKLEQAVGLRLLRDQDSESVQIEMVGPEGFPP